MKNKKLIFTVVIALVVLFTSCIKVKAATDADILQVPTQVSSGAEFDITINLEESANYITMDLLYDTSNITISEDSGDSGIIIVNNEGGTDVLYENDTTAISSIVLKAKAPEVTNDVDVEFYVNVQAITLDNTYYADIDETFSILIKADSTGSDESKSEDDNSSSETDDSSDDKAEDNTSENTNNEEKNADSESGEDKSSLDGSSEDTDNGSSSEVSSSSSDTSKTSASESDGTDSSSSQDKSVANKVLAKTGESKYALGIVVLIVAAIFFRKKANYKK